MPTKKPRIVVTLDADDYYLVKRVAEAGDQSMASVLRDYVEMSRPMLRHLADLADSFARADQERRTLHQAAVEGAVSTGQAIFDMGSGQLPLFFDWLETVRQAVDGDGVTVRDIAGESDPQPVTRGSGREKGGVQGGQVMAE